MTKQEFETLYGKPVSQSDFENKINEMYMACGDMDKSIFVNSLKSISDGCNNTIALTLMCEAVKGEKLVKAYDHLIDKIMSYSSEKQVMEEIRNQIGERAYVKKRLALGLDLSEEDRNYLLTNI